MKTSELKIKLFKQIDALDSDKLEKLYGVFLNFIHGEDNSEDWDKLTEAQKSGINDGIYELSSGEGITNDVVLEELRKKYGIS